MYFFVMRCIETSFWNTNKTKWIWIYDREKKRFKSNQINILPWKTIKRPYKTIKRPYKTIKRPYKTIKRPYSTMKCHTRSCKTIKDHNWSVKAMLESNFHCEHFLFVCNFFCSIWNKICSRTFFVPIGSFFVRCLTNFVREHFLSLIPRQEQE